MSLAPVGNANPPTLKTYQVVIENLKGVDLTNSPSNVAEYRSPEAPNMVRDVPGKVRKRMGYHLDASYEGRINGVYFLNGRRLVHAGTKLYDGETLLSSDLADARSKAWQMDGKLYLLDGKRMLCYGEFDIDPPPEEEGEETTSMQLKYVDEIGTTPIVMIARRPDGGGTVYQPINLMSRFFTDRFSGTESDTKYQLSAEELDEDEVKVKLLNTEGEWVEKTSGFSVNRTTGVVTFTTAPGLSPIVGHDNVEISAAKTREGYADRINHCTMSILYGVNGAADRLFVTGNPEYKNQDWYSQKDDPTYFGDTWYSTIGQDSSAILGYSIVSDALAAHKDEGDDGRNVVIRKGEINAQTGEASFPIANAIQGEGAVSPHAFAYMNESLFATRLGVYAITAQDMTGEKYTQNRSFYINKVLTEEDLTDSFAFTYKDLFLLATPSRIYVLDGLQKTYERNAPYSTFQYECYYWTIPNVRVMFEEEGARCFGTNGGDIMKFYTEPNEQESYNDNGAAIEARWDLPDFDGNSFFRNKTFRYIAVRLAPAISTGFVLWAQSRGLWTRLFSSGARARYFDFTYIDFSKINFSSDTTPRTIGSKIKVKKVDKARFSFRNEELNEPFGIFDVALVYTESGNFKG